MKRHERKTRDHKTPISRRLYAIIAGILLFVMMGIITLTYQGLDKILLIHGAIQTVLASREINTIMVNGSDDFLAAMDSVEQNYMITVELRDRTGRLVYTTDYSGDMSFPPYTENPVELPPGHVREYTELTNLGESKGLSFKTVSSESGGRTFEYIRLGIDADDGGKITIYKLRSDADSSVRLVVAFVSTITVFFAFFALLLMVLFIRRTTKPLAEMSHVTQKMSQLDFSQKCDDSNIEEISLLSRSINEMSDSLETALSDLQEKNEKLQRDYEQEKTIEQLREVFISGMSHELKTPIAIIQGYAEGLGMFIEDGDLETAGEYADTIVVEADRMNTLVMKLLEISRYSSGAYSPVFTSVDIHAVVGEWFERNAKTLEDKGITAVNDIPEGTVISGDSTLVATIVNNYMSNAVSHTEGEKKIIASAEKTDQGKIRIGIFNTGKPIADKDIEKIWDSFYRADKSLSRSQGRFGLGLSIVAAIQKMHEEDYGVENHPDGVEFWFEEKIYT